MIIDAIKSEIYRGKSPEEIEELENPNLKNLLEDHYNDFLLN